MFDRDIKIQEKAMGDDAALLAGSSLRKEETL